MKVLTICARRYNGHELWTLLGVLQQRSHQFEVVSTALTIKDELTFRPNTIRRLIHDVQTVEDFDAITVVSGNMEDTEAYWSDPHVQALLTQFRAANKVTAAICCSVPTLGPIVKDIKVSYFPLVRSRHHLRRYGAILQNTSLTVDTKTITAENQMMSQMWAEEICNALEGKPAQYVFTDSGFKPRGHERRFPPSITSMLEAAKKS